MNNWVAEQTNNSQGSDYREIRIEGKISELIFTIKPESKFWRAGFKLFDPNSNVFPLRSDESLLFHLGSTESDEEYGFTAYLNGKHLSELNKTKKYPRDKLLEIKLTINHTNFVKVHINGSLEFKPKWHLINPDIREKVALIAWGDNNEFKVIFSNINAKNWKDIKNKLFKHSREEEANPLLRITGNDNVFLNSQVDGNIVIGGKKNIFSKTRIANPNMNKKSKNLWSKHGLVIATILGAIIAAPWWPNLLSELTRNNKTKIFNDQNGQIIATSIPTSIPSKTDFLRPLKPLETGKKIGELPNGVYFFANSHAIQYEIDDSSDDFLQASSRDESYKYELQKIDSRYYLLGFISDEAQSKIGNISKATIYTQLFPNKWGGATNLIAIPFDAIYKIQYRDINLDAVSSVTIFDVGFKEVVENPEFHKTDEL